MGGTEHRDAGGKLQLPVRIALALFLLLGFSDAVRAQNAGDYWIENITVIDVGRGSLAGTRSVHILGDRIVAVTAASDPIPAGVRRIQGRGLYLLPGLIDSHVHIAMPDFFLPLLLANGVTLARDLGGPLEPSRQLRRGLQDGGRIGPELRIAGTPIDGAPSIWPHSAAVSSPEEARGVVRSLAAQQVDFIKVYSGLDRLSHTAAIAEAHRLGLRAIGHVPFGLSVLDAIAAGQNEIQHMDGFAPWVAATTGEQIPAAEGAHQEWMLQHVVWSELDQVSEQQLDRLAEQLVSHQVLLCPTLVAVNRIFRVTQPELFDDPNLRYLPESLRSQWSSLVDQDTFYPARFRTRLLEAYSGIARMVAAMQRRGVSFLAGTDASVPFVVPGFALHEELLRLVEAGMRPADALLSATLAPVRALGLEQDYGSVEAGKFADLILLRNNPLEDIANTSRLEAVVTKGRYHDRSDLDSILRDIELRASAENGSTDQTREFELEGEILLEGSYQVHFNGLNWAREVFRLTARAAGGGVGFEAHLYPELPIAPSFSQRLLWDQRHRFERSSLVRHGNDPGRIERRMTEEQVEELVEGKPPQRYRAGAENQFVGGCDGTSLVQLARWASLSTGERKAFQWVFWEAGHPGLTVSPGFLERKPDRRQGGQVFQSYQFGRGTGNGVMTGELLLRPDGLPQEIRFETPVGVVELKLIQDSTR